MTGGARAGRLQVSTTLGSTTEIVATRPISMNGVRVVGRLGFLNRPAECHQWQIEQCGVSTGPAPALMWCATASCSVAAGLQGSSLPKSCRSGSAADIGIAVSSATAAAQAIRREPRRAEGICCENRDGAR